MFVCLFLSWCVGGICLPFAPSPPLSVVFPLSKWEGLVLRHVISCYTPTMAPLLHTQSDALQLFCELLTAAGLSAPNTPTTQELALEQVLRSLCVSRQQAQVFSLHAAWQLAPQSTSCTHTRTGFSLVSAHGRLQLMGQNTGVGTYTDKPSLYS